jgi:hypothetical protein
MTNRSYASERLRWDGDQTEWAGSGAVVTASGPRHDGLVRVLTALRGVARAQADDVLGHVPDTGDAATGRAVDDFVEQAADALRALDETVVGMLRALEDGPGTDGWQSAGTTRRDDAYPSRPERP